MKRIFLLLFMIPSLMMAQKIDGIFKYATIYSSVFANTPMKVRSEYYINQMGEIKDITIENPFDYQATFGIRRVARFDYETRRNRF